MNVRVFKKHSERDVRIQSAITAIKAILPLALYPAHKKELIGICIWKMTEADGKFNTRYRSLGSLESERGVKLQHEHVLEMKKLIADLIERGEDIESVVAKAIGCVVTRDEHSILSAVSKNEPNLHGWERYKRAGIRVFDLEEQREL